MIRMIICTVTCIPLSFLFRLLVSPFLRKLLGLSLGLVMTYIVYREQSGIVLGHSIIIYLLVRTLPNKMRNSVVLVYSFGFLLSYHLNSFLYHYRSWNLDITTILMMNTLKYSAFSFSVSDSESPLA